MKKIVGFCFICATLILVGCSSTKTKVCTKDTNGFKSNMEFTYDGDKVIELVDTVSIDLDKTGYSKEQVESDGKHYKNQYKGIKGLKYTYKVEKNTYTRTAEIDYKKASLAELQKAGLIQTMAKDVSYISLKSSIKSLKDSGMTCK